MENIRLKMFEDYFNEKEIDLNETLDQRKKDSDGKIQYSKMPIEKLIKILQDIEAKSNKKIEIGCNGTLMTLNGENFIIMTNEPQW